MKKTRILLIACLLLFVRTFAQIDNTMYFMDRLPQSTWINPAQTPNCKFYMGGLLVPFFGQLPPSMMLAVNTPVDYNDVFYYGEDNYADSIITPLHPTANVDDFLKKLRKQNYVSTDLQLDLLNFGFKTGEKGYFSFDLSERFLLDIGLPKSLFAFAVKGNAEEREVDLTGLGVNCMYYHQLALGYKYQLSKTLAAGLRAKLLVGVANVKTVKSDVQLTTAETSNNINVESEYVIRTNIPLDVSLDEEGFVEDIEFTEFSSDSIGSYIKDYGLLTSNYGLAFDFGFSKDITNSLSCYFSVEDLGAIHWNRNASTFGLYDEDSMKFEGVVVSDLDAENFDETIDLDSIVDNFKEISYEEGGYKTYLPTKMYFGAKYILAKRVTLGALAKLEFLSHKLQPSFTVSANFKPFKFTAATLSYSCLNGNFNNIGLGLTAHPGPIQWYFVSDNIIGALLFPDNTRSLSVRMGCNLVIGCVDKSKQGSRAKDNNARMLDNKSKKKKSVIPYEEHHKDHKM